jgi:hypothetical protein
MCTQSSGASIDVKTMIGARRAEAETLAQAGLVVLG